jgi:hypothetical protein
MVGGFIARRNPVAYNPHLLVLKLHFVVGGISLDGVEVLRHSARRTLASESERDYQCGTPHLQTHATPPGVGIVLQTEFHGASSTSNDAPDTVENEDGPDNQENRTDRTSKCPIIADNYHLPGQYGHGESG